MNSLKIKYLVTGTGRCGSVFLSRLLTSLGIMCGHEAIFDFQGLDTARLRLAHKATIETSHCSSVNVLTNKPIENWHVAEATIAESSYLAAPFLRIPELKDTKIIHLVRDPFKVIESQVFDYHFFSSTDPVMQKYLNFIYKHIPEIKLEQTEIDKSVKFYIEWNKLIEETAIPENYIRIRIEDQPSIELFNFLNIEPKECFNNKKINSWKKSTQKFDLNDITNKNLIFELIDLKIKYGY